MTRPAAVVAAMLTVLTLPAAAAVDNLLVIPGADSVQIHDLDRPQPKTVQLECDGRRWHLKMLGAGLRKKMMFKVYVAVLYADSSADFGDDPAESVSRQDIARRMVLTLKRDLDASRIADAISRGFIDNVWKGRPDSLLQAQLDQYIGFFGGELRDGQELEVTYLPGYGMFTNVGGLPRPRVTEPRLAHDIWSIWLGKTPISEDLRAKLVRNVAPVER